MRMPQLFPQAEPELRHMEWSPLPREFFEPSASVVAPAMLGHLLVRQTHQGNCAGIIVETEAYLVGDEACHAFRGCTSRNRSMFGPPGHAYVYFIYGCHFCVNAVCQPEGAAEAVLIRAVEPILGFPLMRKFRQVQHDRDLTSGPAKLCAAMNITRSLDGADLCSPGSPLTISRNPGSDSFRTTHGPVATAKRIGINRAAALPLRFYLRGSSWVSCGENGKAPLAAKARKRKLLA